MSLATYCVSLIALLSVTASTQARPNFTGTWAVVTMPGWVAKLSPDTESVVVIKKSATMLSFETRQRSKSTGKNVGRPVPAILYLDGHERRSTASVGSIAVTRTDWNGDELVTTIVTSKGGKITDTSVRKWSVNPEGLLAVETTTSRPGVAPLAPTIMKMRRQDDHR